MIANIKLLKKYCSEYTKIENYEEAVKSPLRYDLHHRREISENKSKKDLIAENIYYNRPPEELIFLEHKEHVRLHNKGKFVSTDTRQRMSEGRKGKHLTTETRQKLSEAMKGKPGPWLGKHRSPETKQKMSEAQKGKPRPWRGKHWHTENGHRVWTE